MYHLSTHEQLKFIAEENLADRCSHIISHPQSEVCRPKMGDGKKKKQRFRVKMIEANAWLGPESNGGTSTMMHREAANIFECGSSTTEPIVTLFRS
jgi:hypothetical protein